MIGFLIMREIGVLLVAIVVAGRSGSSYTAELGSMKMREETDALKTMGFNPVDVLILPRVLVLVIALPVLTFLGSMAALLGAGIVATTYAGMTTELFIDRLNDAIIHGPLQGWPDQGALCRTCHRDHCLCRRHCRVKGSTTLAWSAHNPVTW